VRLVGLGLVGLVTACGGASFTSQMADAAPAPDANTDTGVAAANVAGDYTVDLTTGDNGCMFANWMPGTSNMNVPVTLAQQGTTATATVGGLAALVLVVGLGTAKFQGTVTGDSFSLADYGTAHSTDGDCSYTLKATLTGSISGDSISGQITYSETTNGSPACTYHATCTSVQAFAGVRAPSADGG